MGFFGRFYHILTDNHIHVNCIYIFKKTKNGLFFLITHIDFFIIFSIIVQIIFLAIFRSFFNVNPHCAPTEFMILSLRGKIIYFLSNASQSTRLN